MRLTYRGVLWELGTPVRTSDGFLIANGKAIQEDGSEIRDEDGFAVCHSFFLGKAK